MELKLFGRKIFEFGKSRRNFIALRALESTKESKFLPDFHNRANEGVIWEAVEESAIINTTTGGAMFAYTTADSKKTPPATPKPAEKKKLTPKEVYNLKTLNDKDFKLITDPAYVDAQVEHFKDKLNLIKSEEYDMRRGVEQIASVLVRMENRKKYAKHNKFFDQFPYTTSTKIAALTKEHDNLQLGQVAQFLADMPKDATDTMKAYNAEVAKLCGKQAVFYIIADKKDFKKTDSRRDPILLAQSPFGHVWQILGAWDEEMLFLEEL